VWVQLKVKYAVERGGMLQFHNPGDWINIGKQEAMLLLSRGDAEVPEYVADNELISEDMGVVVRGGAGHGLSDPLFGKLPVETAPPFLQFERTLLLACGLEMRTDLVPVGLSLLDRWELAVPLWDYDELARDVGSQVERERTEVLVHDLRVPLYDTRLIFARDCQNVAFLIDLWSEELDSGVDEQHAFLRALYIVKPLILALPRHWTRPYER
jgi:hypothetical protein